MMTKLRGRKRKGTTMQCARRGSGWGYCEGLFLGALLLVVSGAMGSGSRLTYGNADCLLSACQFSSSGVLKSQEWRAGECRHNIPKGAFFQWKVQGNVSIYLFKRQSMLDFKRGGKISGLLADDMGSNGSYAFASGFSLGDGGIYFVVYNSNSNSSYVTYEAGFVVKPAPKAPHLPCGNFTTMYSCETAVIMDGIESQSCVWCPNPCGCMTLNDARNDCGVGWDAQYLAGSINVPDFSFDAWGYAGM